MTIMQHTSLQLRVLDTTMQELVDLLVVLVSVDETMNQVVRGAKIARWNWTGCGDCSV